MSTATTTYRDGGYIDIPDGEVVFLEEGQTPWALDADGNEIREGDTVLVLPGAAGPDGFGKDWVGAIAVLEPMRNDSVYDARGRVKDAIWPNRPNGVSLSTASYPSTRHWAIPGRHLRRVDLSSADGLRILLAHKLGERSNIDAQAARIENDRVRLSLEIARIREDLEAAS